MEVITTHINADFDSLASMLAAKKMHPDAVMVFPGSQERSLRDFFLHSTFYLFQTKKMKEIDLDKVDKLILVDTRQKSRIGRFSELASKKDVEIVVYDHHPKSKDDIKRGDMTVEPTGSTTTIMVELLKRKRKRITGEEATILMLGIYEDTGSLSFTTTTERDYQAAAYLLKKGANLNVVSDLMTKEMTSAQIIILNELISNMTFYNVHGVEVAITTASSKDYVGDLAVLVHKLKDIENLNALIVLARMEDRLYLIARSRIEMVNVGVIAEAFGGGGHSTAASATVKGMTLIEAKNELLKVLHEKIKPKRSAGEIMVYPVRVVDSKESFKKTQSIMSRLQLNALPVVSGKKVVGIITRNIVEKALAHMLGNYEIKEYMISDFSTVVPETSLLKLQELIIDNKQKIVPVIKDGEVFGVVTMTDLLRVYSSDRTEESAKQERDDVSSVLRNKTIAKMMDDILSQDIRAILKEVGRVGDLLGCNVYVVGGFVRDLILRTENLDIDIVVEGDGIAFANAYAKENECHINCHRKFRTAVIVLPTGFKIDIASARVEYYKHPAALPEIEVSSLKLDLYRRDFTINTLAMRLNSKGYGELVDYFGAYKDIKAKMIRVLHNLSFVEDPTRVFRAVRFEQRFDFNIDKPTLNLIKNAVKIDLFHKLSGKRLLTEFRFMFEENDPIPILCRLNDLNLFDFVHKKIDLEASMGTLLRLKDVISWYSLLYLEEKDYKKWLTYFTALIEPLDMNDRDEIKKRLSIVDNHSIKVIRNSKGILNQLNQFYKLASSKEENVNSKVYHLLEGLSTEVILYMMAKTDSKRVKKLISRYFTHLKHIKVMTTGNDLIDLGYKAGKDFKEIFSKLLDEKLDGKLKTRENELDFIKKLNISSN